ncbi:Protein of unknown function [Cotesia congregata]|uniref:Uncharacterized protein n=1 Tax=Cotesia congregata TaxID=51543 RepID=A0A8J2MSE7_COTCN|nr:Protein of unknown function [Cotesia congregata]
MFSFQTDMMMIEFLSTFKRRMAKLDKLDNMDCPECSGPPPIFRLPPPPRPPFLTETAFCSEAPLAELEDCVAFPMIDASYHANPSLQNTALIIACTVILLLMAAIVSVVFWKHKRKVQNLLPCKSAVSVTATTGRTRVLPNGQALTSASSNMMGGNNTARLYEDMMEHVPHSQIHNHLPAQLRMQPTIEVRGIDPSRQQVSDECTPASHYLDYLDYRDPRTIISTNKMPSKAILGGYRTPMALLAKKSQGVMTMSPPITTLHRNFINDYNHQQQRATDSINLQNTGINTNTATTNSLLINNLTLNNQNPFIMTNPTIIPGLSFVSMQTNVNRYCCADSNQLPPSHYSIPNDLITSTHNSRFAPTNNDQLFESQATCSNISNNSNIVSPLTINDKSKNSNCEVNRKRRLSVDSEGYAYIDIEDYYLNKLEKTRGNYRIDGNADRDGGDNIDESCQRLLNDNTAAVHESSSVEVKNKRNSERSCSNNRGTTNSRTECNSVDGTNEEICPLCTIQQIHHLMIDVNKEKNGNRGFVCSSPGPDPYGSQDLYNPVYEELCNGDNQPDTDEEGEINGRKRLHHRASANSKSASEDEFAEDELSVGEPSESRVLTSASPGPVSWSTCPAGSSRTSRERRGKSPRSLDRRRKNKTHDVGEFHEGMLLDALLQFYPNVPGIAGTKTNSSQRTKPAVTVAHKFPYYVPQMPPQFHSLNREINNKEEENPYESVPVLGPLHNYSSQSKTNPKDKSSSKVSTVNDYDKYPQYGSEYFGLHNQVVTPIYTQVGNDYSDTYAQPTDKLYYSDDRYAQPVYFTSRDPEQTSAGKLYQGQPDSSFGSDSGYSHHTSGGTTIYNNGGGTRSSITRTNHRKDKHRNSNHSHHSIF